VKTCQKTTGRSWGGGGDFLTHTVDSRLTYTLLTYDYAVCDVRQWQLRQMSSDATNELRHITMAAH